MGAIVQDLDRDVVLNLCQYGMEDVWQWGTQVGGHCWRTTGDLGLTRGPAGPGFYRIGLSNAQHTEFAGPGSWNDPDYILIGWVGDARNKGMGRPTRMTASQQYSYMSMWCLMAAPLIFSGDMTKLDEFTLNVLCNAEVIGVNQDPLGKQASIIRYANNDQLVMAKPMSDGSLAVGLFNLSRTPRGVSVSWEELDIDGTRIARDLWRQRDLGRFKKQFKTTLNPYAVKLIRLRKP
jgi:alpha-galactosidase